MKKEEIVARYSPAAKIPHCVRKATSANKKSPLEWAKAKTDARYSPLAKIPHGVRYANLLSCKQEMRRIKATSANKKSPLEWAGAVARYSPTAKISAPYV